MNEAALFAARGNKRVVSMVEFEKAKNKPRWVRNVAPW
ncbi:hypothetical protein ACLK15_18445 [Escherichia coli]